MKGTIDNTPPPPPQLKISCYSPSCLLVSTVIGESFPVDYEVLWMLCLAKGSIRKEDFFIHYLQFYTENTA
jgi:hypothetical protein